MNSPPAALRVRATNAAPVSSGGGRVPAANALTSPAATAYGRGVTPASFSPAAWHMAPIAPNRSFRITTAIDRRSPPASPSGA